MGYIKKLKNNELVGGTDKHTIYPVTSTEAVFEEVSENNFESQKYLNNHIYGGEGGRINQESITNYNIAKGTLSEDRLDTALKTKVQEGYDTSWKFKGEYDKWATYDAHDVVYDPATNSSYISLQADNQWHPVDTEDEAYVEGWWQVIMDGKVSTDANNALVEYIENDLTQHVTDAISDADGAIQDMRSETLDAYTEAEQLAQQITDWSSSEISSTPSYTDQHPLSNRASSAQVGYFECGTSSTTQASNQIKAVTAGGYALPTSGGAVKIKMYAANTYTPTTNNPVKLQFNADATTLKELRYNGEAVSPDNTWDAGEVISVYYDGTYYQASNAQGGSNKKIDAYLLGDLRTLAVGQTYNVGEAVKTTDKQLLKIIKEVGILNRTDEVATGDLKVYGSGNNAATYKALQAVNIYTGNDSDYESGAYAIGNYSKYELTVTASTNAGTITVNDVEIEITENESVSEIATAIVNAVTIEGWTLSANNDVVSVKCNTIGNKTTAITFNAGDTGVTLSGNDTPSVAGTTVVRTFDGTVWTNVSLADYVASGVWSSITVSELQLLTTSQNTVNSYFKAEKSVAGYITAKGNTSQCLYRNIRLEKGRSYTVYIKATAAVSQRKATFFFRGGLITDKIPCNETDTNNERAITTQNLANGLTLVFTPKESVESAALWMWTDTYSSSVPLINYSISWTEYVNTFEEKVEWDYKQKEEIEYTTETRTIGNVISGRYVQAKASESGFGGLVTVANNDYRVTDYIDCLGVKKLRMPIVRTKVYTAGLVFYDINKTPIITDFDYCLYAASASNIYRTIDVPENAAYFRNSTWPESWNYTFYYNRDVTEQVELLTDEVDGLLKKTETIPDGIESYVYEGEKISFTPRFAAQQLFTSPSSLQGCANYDKYLFMLSLATRTLNIYDLTTNGRVGQAVLPEFEISTTHGNTLTFSNQFVENGDEFPVLYLPSGYSNGTDCHVYGYRIVRSGSTFTATLVKTIVLAGATGWTEFVCDNVNNKAWIKWETQSEYRWYNVNMPALSDDTPINLSSLTPKFLAPITSDNQSHLYDNQKIYIPAGRSNGKLYVLDTNTGEYVTILDLSKITSSEPEGVCIYDGHLYIMFASAVYKIYLS